jgi:hypothetical protein
VNKNIIQFLTSLRKQVGARIPRMNREITLLCPFMMFWNCCSRKYPTLKNKYRKCLSNVNDIQNQVDEGYNLGKQRCESTNTEPYQLAVVKYNTQYLYIHSNKNKSKSRIIEIFPEIRQVRMSLQAVYAVIIHIFKVIPWDYAFKHRLWSTSD